MARITVNTTGTAPHIYLTTDVDAGNIFTGANANSWLSTTSALDVTCLQDVTITNSTGVFSWTDFCSIDMNKVTTPADNSIETNIVIDPVDFFGDGTTPQVNAQDYGVNGLSSNKIEVQFVVVMNGELDTPTANAYYYQGIGYITSVAPTVSPEAPVWVSPMTIAVDGALSSGQVTS